MSVTDRDVPAATPPRPAPPLRQTLSERVQALWSRRVGQVLVGMAAAAALLVFLLRRTFPNYDTYYALLWGQELANGHLPDYAVVRPPTPHPLATAVGWLLAPFGTGADRLIVLLSLLGLVVLLVVVFRFTQRLLGPVVGLLAVAVILTRTDLDLTALRAVFDLPFYVLVFAAAALEIGRPRRGWPVLALLALAGLLRPEAWLLAGVYWLWLVPATPPRQLARLALLVIVAPVLWMLADLVVTGEPLYSLTSTREVAGEFERQRGLGEAIRRIPDYLGGNDRIVTLGVGGLGLLLALWILRRRAALPLVLGGLGIASFLVIAGAGLSAIPRYLMIPSLLLSACVAVALGGWTVVREPRARAVAIGIAVLSVLVIGWRAPYYVSDLRVLDRQTRFVQGQHRSLMRILDHRRVAALVGRCGPITVPTHSAIPVIRYKTGLPADAVQASIEQTGPPVHGLLFVGRTFNWEPSGSRAATSRGHRSASRKPWSNRPLPGYERIARTGRWAVWARCPDVPGA